MSTPLRGSSPGNRRSAPNAQTAQPSARNYATVQSAPRTMRRKKGERRVCEFISSEDLNLTFNQLAALVV